MNRLRWTLLALSLVVGAIFAFRLSQEQHAINKITTSIPANGKDSFSATERAKGLAAIPEYASFFDKLHEAYPIVYATVILKQPEVTASANWQDADLIRATQILRRNRGIVAANAPLPVLQKINASFEKIMEALSAQDSHLCTDFFYGGDAESFVLFASTHRALVANFANAWLEAIQAGHSNIEPPPDVTDEDVQTFDAALSANGMERDMIDALLDSQLPDPPPSYEATCQLGILYLKTMLALPEDSRTRLLARSALFAARS